MIFSFDIILGILVVETNLVHADIVFVSTTDNSLN